MTKDICYVVRLEEDGHNYWLGADYDQSDCNEYFAVFNFNGAAHFDNEEDVKEALKSYYKDTHTMGEKDRAFVCKVSVSDCACFVKSDIDLLLKEK